MSLSHPATGERLSLTVRTSLLNEYRNSAGQLRAFEVRRGYTSFGGLCSALAKIPGVMFEGLSASSWYPRPATFTFRGHRFQVAIAFTDYWVGPTQIGEQHVALKELLDFVKREVLRPHLSLGRTHYVSNA
jgi:hypothetical protein